MKIFLIIISDIRLSEKIKSLIEHAYYIPMIDKSISFKNKKWGRTSSMVEWGLLQIFSSLTGTKH